MSSKRTTIGSVLRRFYTSEIGTTKVTKEARRTRRRVGEDLQDFAGLCFGRFAADVFNPAKSCESRLSRSRSRLWAVCATHPAHFEGDASICLVIDHRNGKCGKGPVG